MLDIQSVGVMVSYRIIPQVLTVFLNFLCSGWIYISIEGQLYYMGYLYMELLSSIQLLFESTVEVKSSRHWREIQDTKYMVKDKWTQKKG